jgi:SPP1 family predicted phage head-tail adaptor
MSTEFSGALDQRVTVQIPIDTSDGGGGSSRTWQDVRDFWAYVVPQSQDERRYAGHVATRNRYDVFVRRDGDIPLIARLLWNKRRLTILAVEDDPAHLDRLRIIAEQEREP